VADVSPDKIMQVAMGFMASKHLFIASEIGLFEALVSGPATLDELTKRCGVPRRTLSISAAAMVSLGLLERQGERYANGAVALTYLAGRGGLDLRPMLRFWDRISYPGWLKLADAVRTGRGQSHFATFNDEEQRIFSSGVQAFSAPMAAALASAYDFGPHKQVLDIAGGTGSFLVAALKQNAALKGTLFDLPGACDAAARYLANKPERKRITVMAGDIFKNRLPSGHDVLILANTAHVLSVAQNLNLLKKLRADAASGTRLLLVDLWTDPTHAAPPAAALMSGEFLIVAGDGQAYSEEEADGWLKQTGWRKIERKPLASDASMIVAEAA
jgi:hypothetical protein